MNYRNDISILKKRNLTSAILEVNKEKHILTHCFSLLPSPKQNKRCNFFYEEICMVICLQLMLLSTTMIPIRRNDENKCQTYLSL